MQWNPGAFNGLPSRIALRYIRATLFKFSEVGRIKRSGSDVWFVGSAFGLNRPTIPTQANSPICVAALRAPHAL